MPYAASFEDLLEYMNTNFNRILKQIKNIFEFIFISILHMKLFLYKKKSISLFYLYKYKSI